MSPRSGRCRQNGCSNTFNEIIGGQGWGMKEGKRLTGDCLPCHFAAQFHNVGRTVADIELVPELSGGIKDALERGGWTWSQLVESYDRTPHPVML